MSTATLKKSVVVEIALIRFLVVIIQLVFLKVYTNYTSIYELGIYYFLFTVSYSLNSFLLIPLDYFQQSRLYSLKQDHVSLRSFYGLNLWVLKLSAIMLISAELVCYILNPEYCFRIVIIVALGLSNYMVTLLRGIINNLERRRQAIYCLMIESVLKIVFFFALIRLWAPSAMVILVTLLAASLATLGVLVLLVRRLPEYRTGEIREYTKKEVALFSYPISISAVINWIQTQGYRMILVPLGLVEIVGIYGTVANVGNSGMNAYSTVFQQLFVPNLYKTHGKFIATYMRNAILSILFVLICGYALSGYIIKYLTKPELVKYASIIVYGILAEGGNFLIGALTIYLTIHNVTKITIRSSITGLITFFVSFFALYLMGRVNVFTIGMPIVVTQMVITLYLLWIVKQVMIKHAK